MSLLMVLFSPTIIWAGDITENSLEKLMELSGINKQVAEYPGMVKAGFDQATQQGSPVSAPELIEIHKIMQDTFQPSGIIPAIKLEIKNNISESEAKVLLTWYESDLGKMITKAEEDASTPAGLQEMLKEGQTLLADEESVRLARKLDQLANATDVTMQIQENIGVAVFTAISTAMNPNQPVNIDAFKAQMSAQEQQMRANIEQFVILSFIYAYKDIDSVSIEKYVGFLERPGTRKFNDSAIEGIKIALNQSIGRMAESLAVTFKKHSKNKGP